MTVTTAGDPPNALGTDGPEPYAPMVWDSTLPKANSVIASTYANATTPKDQYTEASKLNTMIIEQNHQTFDTPLLHSITSPAAAMLVQVTTSTCQLRVIFGLAKYVANPLASDMSLHGLYFAIGEDLTSPTDAPLAVHLPDDVLKTNQVQIPTDQAFEDMLGTKSAAQSNCHLDTEQWFKVSTATTRATLAKAVPIPLYLAYDACASDIMAHVESKPGPNTGVTGLVTQPQSTSTPSSKTPTPSSGTQSSPLSLLGSGQVTTAKAAWSSKFNKRSLKHFQPLARPSNWLASKAQSTKPMESTSSPSSGVLKVCNDKTPPLYPN